MVILIPPFYIPNEDRVVGHSYLNIFPLCQILLFRQFPSVCFLHEQKELMSKYIASIGLNIAFESDTMTLCYSILFYKDVDQVESLLRAIYRPHNFYCLHVDNESNQTVKDLTYKLASCFDNV